MTVKQEAAGFELNQIIEFVELDLSNIGGSFFRMYNSMDVAGGGDITFLGETWSPVPFISEGWGKDSSGRTPRPTITISDFEGLLLAEAILYEDLVGATVKRYETTFGNVAGGSFYGPEIWSLNQKIEADGFIFKVGLASPMDQQAKRLPGWNMFHAEFPALGKNRLR